MSELEFLCCDRAQAGGGFRPVLRSSLHRHLREAGAEFEERDGWLVATKVPGRALRIRDISHTGKIEVRGELDDVDLPSGAEVVRITRERALILCAYRQAAQFRAELRQQFRAVVDMTGALAGVEIEGAQAPTLMRRLTDLDLDSLPAVGAVARVPAVVLLDGEESFRLFFPQEYGHYLWAVAVDAAEPLGGGPAS